MDTVLISEHLSPGVKIGQRHERGRRPSGKATGPRVSLAVGGNHELSSGTNSEPPSQGAPVRTHSPRHRPHLRLDRERHDSAASLLRAGGRDGLDERGLLGPSPSRERRCWGGGDGAQVTASARRPGRASAEAAALTPRAWCGPCCTWVRGVHGSASRVLGRGSSRPPRGPAVLRPVPRPLQRQREPPPALRVTPVSLRLGDLGCVSCPGSDQPLGHLPTLIRAFPTSRSGRRRPSSARGAGTLA